MDHEALNQLRALRKSMGTRIQQTEKGPHPAKKPKWSKMDRVKCSLCRQTLFSSKKHMASNTDVHIEELELHLDNHST